MQVLGAKSISFWSVHVFLSFDTTVSCGKTSCEYFISGTGADVTCGHKSVCDFKTVFLSSSTPALCLYVVFYVPVLPTLTSLLAQKDRQFQYATLSRMNEVFYPFQTFDSFTEILIKISW